ncbi:hypothetical protein [Methylorubrum populi]|jgi:hypothetical protein|uniref:hypothetical protein n=1 Tax=Methylorubrum populi TaxID=223967 RepID=UPI001300F29F|nr:hypothetical protein [Methylorubrum populi]
MDYVYENIGLTFDVYFEAEQRRLGDGLQPNMLRRNRVTNGIYGHAVPVNVPEKRLHRPTQIAIS